MPGGSGWLGVRGPRTSWGCGCSSSRCGGPRHPWRPWEALGISWKLAADGLFLCLLVPPASGRVFHQRRGSGSHSGRLIRPCLPSNNPAVSAILGPSVIGGYQESLCFQVQAQFLRPLSHGVPAFGDRLSHMPVLHYLEDLAKHA